MPTNDSTPPRQTRLHLTWQFLASGDDYLTAAREAFYSWAVARVFTFTELRPWQPGAADIVITFADLGQTADGRDRFASAKKNDDFGWHIRLATKVGGGRTTARWRRTGQLHGLAAFWQRHFSQYLSLDVILAHEIGHCLGLPHTDEPGSIMAEHYTSRTNPRLTQGDLHLLRSLYADML